MFIKIAFLVFFFTVIITLFVLVQRLHEVLDKDEELIETLPYLLTAPEQLMPSQRPLVWALKILKHLAIIFSISL